MADRCLGRVVMLVRMMVERRGVFKEPEPLGELMEREEDRVKSLGGLLLTQGTEWGSG